MAILTKKDQDEVQIKKGSKQSELLKVKMGTCFSKVKFKFLFYGYYLRMSNKLMAFGIEPKEMI